MSDTLNRDPTRAALDWQAVRKIGPLVTWAERAGARYMIHRRGDGTFSAWQTRRHGQPVGPRAPQSHGHDTITGAKLWAETCAAADEAAIPGDAA